MHHHDLMSLRVFSSLQKLTLAGIMGVPDERCSLHRQLLINLARMTQLTCLNSSLKGRHVQQDSLDEQLAALFILTSLDIFSPCFVSQMVWSSQIQKYVEWPTVGNALKAAWPQAASMSVFDIKIWGLNSDHTDVHAVLLRRDIVSKRS